MNYIHFALLHIARTLPVMSPPPSTLADEVGPGGRVELSAEQDGQGLIAIAVADTGIDTGHPEFVATLALAVLLAAAWFWSKTIRNNGLKIRCVRMAAMRNVSTRPTA